MLAVGWITASLNKNAQDVEWNYSIPIDPSIYLIVGIFVQSIVDVIDQAVRSLGPFYALAQGYQRPDVLWADYSSSILLWEAWTACRDGHYLVCSSMLASLATTVFTIFLGSLQLSASSYGSTTFESDLATATASTLLVAFVLAVHLALGYHFSWPRRASLPRAPANTAAVIPYVIYSSGLRADLKGVAGRGSTRRKIQRLESLDARYGFGKFGSGGTEHYRVEKHHDQAGALTLIA
ncbi:hypothetical protein B0J18DRAFT_116928 [Chaetomium sp. MPI-SDFR-AT-0129]|nr:hypothetical protein B0J18DRAFT_116928 [Chaetomium sp. MPI-SDFR-AT-0129]